MSQNELMAVFKFNQQDLAANREGKLSAAQAARWAEAGQWSKSVTETVIPLGITLLFIIIGIVMSLNSVRPQVGILIYTVCAIFAGLVARFLSQLTRSAKLETTPTVAQAEGTAKLTDEIGYDEHSSSRRYRLEIEHYTFQLFTKAQFEALKSGERYAVYFMDDENQYIVSIEKLT
ncbi:MAG: hypothetical protein KC445_18825 [Anaerolineales bacterium]|nr:hypothetical protein [Anaerolineales bacterium]